MVWVMVTTHLSDLNFLVENGFPRSMLSEENTVIAFESTYALQKDNELQVVVTIHECIY